MRPSLVSYHAAFALMLAASPANCAPLTVEGTVVDLHGTPVPYVRVTIAGAAIAPLTTTVFSVQDGKFSAHLKDADPDQIKIESFRIGWQETAREVTQQAADTTQLKLTLQPLTNVADQVPASAWIPGKPGDRDFHILINECAGCHQLGAARVKRFAQSLAGQPVETRTAAWDAIVQYMRAQALRIGPSGDMHLRWGLTEESEDYKMATAPETSFFLPRDMERVVPYLAKHYPTSFDTYTDYNDIERLGEYGVTAQTVVEEYQLPTFGWTREVSIAPGSRKVWFLELDADRLGALDPTDGKVEWFDVPGEGPQGPHTLNADAEGNLWVPLEESYSIGRFNTQTHEWRVYPPPPGVKFAITHDTAINSKRQVQFDAHGRLWLTLVGINELWSVDVKTGEVKRFPMP